MGLRGILTGALFLALVVAGCGGGSESPAERAGDLRQAHDQIEGELLLNEVEQGVAEYAAAKENGNRSGEESALREVHRAAFDCWEFGLESCPEIVKVESTVLALEEEAHQKIPFTHPPSRRAH
jgi:hypothetical protein